MVYGRTDKFKKFRKTYGKYKKNYKRRAPIVKRVRKIEKAVKEQTRKLYLVNQSQDQVQNTLLPFIQFRLTAFNNDVSALGTDQNDLLGAKVKLNKIQMHGRVSLEGVDNEEETLNLTMALVSLKDDFAYKLDESNGLLTLVSNEDYYQYSGWTYLNLDVFKVHKIKHLTLTNHGADLGTSGAQTQMGTDYNFNWNVRPNAIIQARRTTSATTESWKTLICPSDPSKNYWLLVFNDDSSVDVEQAMVKMLCMKTLTKLDN